MNLENLRTPLLAFSIVATILAAISTGLYTYFGHIIAIKKEQTEARSGTIESITSKKSDSIIYPQLEIGNSGSFISNGVPDGVLFRWKSDNSPLIKIIIVNNNILLSTTVRAKNGDIIAEIIDNEWKTSPILAYDRNYSNNAFEVKDSKGDIVFQVKIKDKRAQILGKFYSKTGFGWLFYQLPASEGGGGSLIPIPPEAPEPKLQITPMFQYPSNKYLSVLANSERTNS
ncbi:hypothetical protein GETHLI_35740 [Geothrix limicola]|uniref:Uncharacterized protein n=1 Tax=Geothrix limicola TaxID=2927978 RepID=A0ABQ5QLJ7_9BACT|nr:hypothetical protein [Geothrix limicola]GLH75071.1 hypothetical protein GETHLI_35740 [Geothrix limicola]